MLNDKGNKEGSEDWVGQSSGWKMREIEQVEANQMSALTSVVQVNDLVKLIW